MNKRERQQLVEECRNSGMTAKAWAQVRLLRYIRYSYVCERCEKETGEATIVKAPNPAPFV